MLMKVDTSVVRELLSASVRVRIPTNIPDYAGIVERLLDDLGTIADQAMNDAYKQGVHDLGDLITERAEAWTKMKEALDDVRS